MKNLTIPASILIGCIILGGFFYAVQVKKQDSIERQQFLNLQADSAKQVAEEERKEKEYDANRKSDCLKVYTTESDKWNNVRGWRYDELSDVCYIRYKELQPKSDAECNELFPTKGADGKPLFIWFRDNTLCKEGEFENSF